MINITIPLLMTITPAEFLPNQIDEAVINCDPGDADQHKLCQMARSGDFLGINPEMKFILFDLMTGRRIKVFYAFPLNKWDEVETAIQRHMRGAKKYHAPWGHPESTLIWLGSNRKYMMEIHDGKISVSVEAVSEQ